MAPGLLRKPVERLLHAEVFNHTTNIGEHVESALGMLAANTPDPVEASYNLVPPALKRRGHLLNRRLALRRLQCNTGSNLIVRRNAGEVVDVQIAMHLGFLDCWINRPADPAAGPGESLGHRRGDDRARRHAGNGSDRTVLFTVEDDCLVGFIGVNTYIR